MKIIFLLAAFFALMLAAYPSKPIPRPVAVSITKPVILHRDKPVIPAIYDLFYADQIPAEIPKPSVAAQKRMNHYMNKVTLSTNPSKQQFATLSRNEAVRK